jgi:Pentapeptide repeats (9 copies)
VTARSNRPDQPTPRPLSNGLIATGTLVVLIIVAVIWFLLLRRYGGEGPEVQLDAIRTAGTLVIGTGGAVALLLTARRQRYTELTLVHTDRDATERRITELYTKAADQLGSDQAPVRLAGLYALERLAHSTVEHRQTIVDVLCAYLRMPHMAPQVSMKMIKPNYRSPGTTRRRRAQMLTDRSPLATPTSGRTWREHIDQEREVRMTAQTILLRNLRIVSQHRRRRWHRTPSPAPTWPGIGLNLNGARLFDFSLSHCQLDDADFKGAEFIGEADFSRAKFTGSATFEGAQFTDWATFEGAQFTGEADFSRAKFIDWAYFVGAQFTHWVTFENTQFTDRAYLADAQFTGTTYFEGAQFGNKAEFARARFASRTTFEDALFTGSANFEGATFVNGVNFAARVTSVAEPGALWPPNWRARSAEPASGEDPAFLYLAKVTDNPHA